MYRYSVNDSINYNDPLGLLRFSIGFASKYPKSYSQISTLSSRITSTMYTAFAKYGQASRSQVNEALSAGKGPQIDPAQLGGAYGAFTPGISSQKIEIDIGLLLAFEQGSASGKLLDATILHELTHYFDDQDGSDFPGEEGNFFEIDCFGGVVSQ